MSALKLVSAGDDIKIWDCRGFGNLGAFHPHDGNVSDVCWSHCGKFIASCSESDDKVAVTHIQNTSSPVEIDVEKGNLCVDLNSKSRYLLCGGKNCIVNIWDLKTRKLKKSFKEHQTAITSVAFNWNDAYIAAGSKSGDIILHNFITGQSGSPLRAPKVQAIQQIKYNAVRKSLFASASDDGAINLWDANSRQLKHSFNDIHKAPATSLAFSPVNEMLLISVGLDKRIALYDVQGKQNLSVSVTDSPLTAIDMMIDGSTMAVGTSRGTIIVYDIRQGSSPIHTFNAHNGAISSLSFYPKVELSSGEASGVEMKKKDLPSAPKQNDTNSNISVAPRRGDKPPMKQPTQQSVEVFSPAREGFQGSFTDDSSLPLTDVVNSTVNSDHSPAGTRGLFSPLQGLQNSFQGKFSMGNSLLLNSSNYSYSQGASSLGAPSSNGSYVVSPSHSSLPAETGLNGHAAMNEMAQRGVSASPSFTQIHRQDVNCSASENENLSHSEPRAHTGDGRNKKVMFTDCSPEATAVKSMVKDAIDDCREDLKREIQGDWQGAHSPSSSNISTAGSGDQNVFQTEFTRNLIREALEDFRDEIHQDITNLHLDMLRQFQIQQNEVLSMLQHLSVNKEILTEMEELRQENKRLKKTF